MASIAEPFVSGRRAVALMGLIAVLEAGCVSPTASHHGHLFAAGPLPSEQRKQLGRVTVISLEGAPGEWQRPLHGRAARAKGASEGLQAGTCLITHGYGLPFLMYAPVGALFGAASGALRDVPPEQTELAIHALTNALFESSVAVRTGESIHHGLQTLMPELKLTEPAQFWPRALPLPGQPLAVGNTDTALIVRLEALELSGAHSVNPRLALSCYWRAELRRVSDGLSLQFVSGQWRHGAQHRLLGWAANDARLFRAALAEATTAMGRGIIEQLLGPAEAP